MRELILNEEETRNLIYEFIHPNEEALKLRDLFISDIGNARFNEDGYAIIANCQEIKIDEKEI